MFLLDWKYSPHKELSERCFCRTDCQLDKICKNEADLLHRPVPVPHLLLNVTRALEQQDFGHRLCRGDPLLYCVESEQQFLEYEKSIRLFVARLLRPLHNYPALEFHLDLNGEPAPLLAAFLLYYLQHLKVRLLDTACYVWFGLTRDSAPQDVRNVQNCELNYKLRQRLVTLPSPFYQTFVFLCRHWNRFFQQRALHEGERLRVCRSLACVCCSAPRVAPDVTACRKLFLRQLHSPAADFLHYCILNIELICPRRIGMSLPDVCRLDGTQLPLPMTRIMTEILKEWKVRQKAAKIAFTDHVSSYLAQHPDLVQGRLFSLEFERFENILHEFNIYMNTDRPGELSAMDASQFHMLVNSQFLRHYLVQLPEPLVSQRQGQQLAVAAGLGTGHIWQTAALRQTLLQLKPFCLDVICLVLLFMQRLLEMHTQELTEEELVSQMAPLIFRDCNDKTDSGSREITKVLLRNLRSVLPEKEQLLLQVTPAQ